MTQEGGDRPYQGPTGWAWWAGWGALPWLVANFVVLFSASDLSDRSNEALSAGQWSFTVGVFLAIILGRIPSLAKGAWIAMSVGGLINGASFGPILSLSGWTPRVSVFAGATLAVLGFCAGAVQFHWINQGSPGLGA